MIFRGLEEYIAVHWVLQAALVAALILLGLGVLVRRSVSASGGGILPDEGLTVRNVMEVLVEWLAGMAEERTGPEWRRYFPIIGTMFFFILISNLLGLLPTLDGATSDVNTTAAWAIIAWGLYTWIGITKHRSRYLVKFLGPSFFDAEIGGRVVHMRLLAPIFIVLEIPLDFARMLTLTVRLLANMYADHTVIVVWLSLAPIGVPAIFMGLGLVISFLQAFVFALLTMIYIGLALDDPP